MKKKRRTVIVFSIGIILACIAVLVIAKVRENRREIPYIAFMENFDRSSCLYICANGYIYASTSEEAFTTPIAELSEKIQCNEYADILKFVGTTDARKVYNMYCLFEKVVVTEDYYIASKSNSGPASDKYGEKVRYWTGIGYNEDGHLTYYTIYQSKSDKICSDKRAYKILEWMYECLKDYF